MDFSNFPQNQALDNIKNSFSSISDIVEIIGNDSAMFLLAKQWNTQALQNALESNWLILNDRKYNTEKLAKKLIKLIDEQEKNKNKYTDSYKAQFDNFLATADKTGQKQVALKLFIYTENFDNKTEDELKNIIDTRFETRYNTQRSDGFNALRNKFAEKQFDYQLESSFISWFQRTAMEYSLEAEDNYVKNILKKSGTYDTGSDLELFSIYADIEGIWKWNFNDDNINMMVHTTNMLIEEIGIGILSFGVGSAFVSGLRTAKFAKTIYKIWKFTKLANKYKYIWTAMDMMFNWSLTGFAAEVLVGWLGYTLTDQALRSYMQPDNEYLRKNFPLKVLQNWLMLSYLQSIDKIFTSSNLLLKLPNQALRKWGKITVENVWLLWQDIVFNIALWDPAMSKEELIQNMAISLIFDAMFSSGKWKHEIDIQKIGTGTTINNISKDELLNVLKLLEYKKPEGIDPYAKNTNTQEKQTEIERIERIERIKKIIKDNKNLSGTEISLLNQAKTKLQNDINTPKQNNNQTPDNPIDNSPETITAPQDIIVIWDLDWSYSKMAWILEQADLVTINPDKTLNRTGWNQKIVLVWDMVADRMSRTDVWSIDGKTNQEAISEQLLALKQQAEDAWWELVILAGNHEDIFLSAASQNNSKWRQNPFSDEADHWLYFWRDFDVDQLSWPQFASTKELLKETDLLNITNWILYMHTSPTPAVLKLITEGNYKWQFKADWVEHQIDITLRETTIQWRVDEINKIRKNWIDKTLSWNTVDDQFNQIANLILNPNNGAAATKNNSQTISSYAQTLYNNGIKAIYHWHTKASVWKGNFNLDFKVKNNKNENIDFPIESVDNQTRNGNHTSYSVIPGNDVYLSISKDLIPDMPIADFQTYVINDPQVRQKVYNQYSNMPNAEFNKMSENERLLYSVLALKINAPRSNISIYDFIDLNGDITDAWKSIITAHQEWTATNPTQVNLTVIVNNLSPFFNQGQRRILITSYACGNKPE